MKAIRKHSELIVSFLNNDERYLSLVGGTRSGKSYSVAMCIILYCLKNAGVAIQVVRATQPSLRRSIWKDYKEILDNNIPARFYTIKNSTLVIEFNNKSYIEFFSCNESQKLRGSSRDILHVEEANEITKEQYDQLNVRTRRKIIFTSNPSWDEKKHWLGKYEEISSTYKDNPFITEEQKEAILSLKGTSYKVFVEGLHGKTEGLIYPEYKDLNEDINFTLGGIDFGYSNDPFAAVLANVKGMDMYLKEVCYKTKMSNAMIVEVLKKYPNILWICDCADPKSINELKINGIKAIACKKQELKFELATMREYNFFIDGKNLKNEMNTYSFKKDTNDDSFFNDPDKGQDDHLMDAMRYAGMYLHRKKNRLNSPLKWEVL